MPTAVSDTTMPDFSSKCHPGTVHSRPDSGSRNKVPSPAATLLPHTTPPSSGSGSGPSSTLRHSIGTPWPSTPRQSVTEAAESSSSANPGPARAPTADCGAKTSLLWRENIPGTALLNDDSPILGLADGTVRVWGSPWSGKVPCYRNESYPVAAIVRLVQAPENRIRRFSPIEAFCALFPSTPPAFIRDTRLQDALCTLLGQVIGLVPVYLLECRPDAAAARLVCKTLFGAPLTPLRSGPENPDRQCR